MNTFPPPDVSLRIGGNDLQAAQKLFPDAANLLYKALEYQRLTGAQDVRFVPQRVDGALVAVFLSGNLKHVYVSPAPVITPQPVREPEVVQPEPPQFHFYQMYSGAVMETPPGGNAKVKTVSSVKVLDRFHPDEVTATAYSLDLAWQQPEKLAVDTAGSPSDGDATSSYPKPSMYSGSMQRVVQALLGIGKQETETYEYISEELPVTYPDVYVFNQYSHTWLKTHGIHKAADGSIWLIEISKDNGVLAMPLPVFTGTEVESFMAWLGTIGDTDSLNVVLEFGGLPTGESFPSGTTLTDAITAGKVLRLLTAAEVAEFYYDSTNLVDKGGSSPELGWAFSASGAKADNITFWYRDFDAAVDRTTWLGDGKDHASPFVRFMSAQHWRITIDLTATPADGFPFGTGSATLQLIEDTYLPTTNVNLQSGSTFPELLAIDMFRVPTGDTETLSLFAIYGRVDNWATDAAIDPQPVFLFYVGEALEVVRRLPDDHISSFSGDSLAVTVPTVSTTACVGLMVPAYCREGYLLVSGDDGVRTPATTPVPYNATFEVYVAGYFGALGLVVFPTITEFFYSDWFFPGSYSMASWPALWLSQGNSAVSIPGPWGLGMSCVLNVGVSGGYLMCDSLLVPYNVVRDYSLGGGPTFERFPDLTVRTSGIAAFEIPADTRPSAVTFVGSP